MNIQNNKRRRESQEKIEQAFMELLQTHEIKNIKVSDIVKMTGVNRSTFYANYVDVYDLADKIREKVNRNSYEQLESYKHISKDEYLLFIFNYIKEHTDLFKVYSKLYYNVDNFLSVYDFTLMQTEELVGDLSYHIVFFKSGILAMAKLWLDNGCKESPEEMLEILKSQYKRFT